MELDFGLPLTIEREVLYDGDYYTEGPVFNQQGGVHFTLLSGGQMGYWQLSNRIDYVDFDGYPNGQAQFDGGFYVCDSKNGRLVRLDPTGKYLDDVVTGTCAGERIRVPNDVIIDNRGGIFFTDSVREDGTVFCITPEGVECVVAHGLDYPNGLVLSADNRYLFVAESYANRIIRIDLNNSDPKAWDIWCRLPTHPDGQLSSNLPDGLAMDKTGRIWVAHYGMSAVQVISPAGKLLASLPTGIPLTSNLCFGTGNALYVTGGSGEPGPGMLIKLTLQNT